MGRGGGTACARGAVDGLTHGVVIEPAHELADELHLTAHGPEGLHASILDDGFTDVLGQARDTVKGVGGKLGELAAELLHGFGLAFFLRARGAVVKLFVVVVVSQTIVLNHGQKEEISVSKQRPPLRCVSLLEDLWQN